MRLYSTILTGFASIVIAAASPGWARAQTPTLPPATDVPGSTTSTLGPGPGAGAVPFGNAPGGGGELLQVRPGAGAGRVPTEITDPGAAIGQPVQARIPPLPALPANALPVFGRFDLPSAVESDGPPNGLTLDQAIERLLRLNLDLISRSYEIPQAQADILTAGLRANPLLYADSQLVPYGSFSKSRPAGPTQYDLNISHPLDLSHKRQARVEVASRAKEVLEAQFQNEVRMQIDNLYTAYVNVLAARLTVLFARRSVEHYQKMLTVAREYLKLGGKYSSDVERLGVQENAARLGLADAEGNLRNARRTLAVLLGVPPSQRESLELRGTVRDRAPAPPGVEALTQIALGQRPDLVAYRLGLARATADVKLARANRYQDVYLLAQPFTFQNNAPYGTKSGVSWAIGVTVPLPVYNRNQGHIERARLNVTQTQIELTSLERQVIADVEVAVQEYALTRAAVERFDRELLPAQQHVVNDVEIIYKGGEHDVVPYLTAQKDFNDLLRQYLDTLIRHRRSMLRLNTAVGQRLLP